MQDQTLQAKWLRVARRLDQPLTVTFNAGFASCRHNYTTFYISKNTNKFRLKGETAWAWYTPKTLATAINKDQLKNYYQYMLSMVKSDPGQDLDLDEQLHTYYAIMMVNQKSVEEQIHERMQRLPGCHQVLNDKSQ